MTERKTSPFLISLTVMLGMIMAIIDATIVNVALATIAGNLGASIDDAAWVATGYILASVITMPLNGWLTAYFGRKKFYAGCILIFTVASFLCGTATNIWQLVVYRVIQGFGGGALQPTAQAIMFETFPPAQRGSAMAIFGLGAMVGPALGPILGGYIVDNASWQLIFYINLPIGLIAFLMTNAFIPNPHYLSKPKGGLDWLGLGLLSSGLASLQYVLERGQHDDWWSSGTITLLAVVSAVTLTWFVVKTVRDKHPLVDLKVFRYRTFTVGNILMTIVGFGLFGTSLIMPLFFQTVMGMTAFDTGMALLPGAVATAICMIIVGRLMNFIDPRVLGGLGMVLFAWSCWALGGLNEQAGVGDVFMPRLVQGFAMGLLFVPLTTVMLGAIPREEMAGATGVSLLLRQLGGSLGIAALTTLLARETAIAWNVLAGGVTRTHGQSTMVLTQLVAQSSSVIAYDYLFRVSAIVFIVALPLVYFMRAPRAVRDAQAAAKKSGGAMPAMAMAE
ncbi:MAG TPA: MDR family MFS transporter [Candidatus Sulfotelmatobacter sp.]|nr:MDR family MFS transporter [Candidatus Sulfotelmatobacter sp.]